jgi:predicted NUDIX family NTP pyrophosphohydrolase
LPTSAGILVYKKVEDKIYVLLAHPGGPYYKNKDEGVWGIPKGLVEDGENPLQTAIREFAEETGIDAEFDELVELPQVKYKNGKLLKSWASRVDDLTLEKFKSNTFQIFWPPKSKVLSTFLEIDALRFFELTEARIKIHPIQLPLIDFISNQ